MLTTERIQKGKKWVEQNCLNRELFHHGIKGQKWGVKNGPPYPLKGDAKTIRSVKKSKLIEEEIRSGKISITINRDKQGRHTKDGHSPGRSYLNGGFEYAQTLINSLSGTGTPVMSRKGEWTRKEKVESPNNIGAHVDENGTQTTTNKAMIVYSKTGSHIYPRKEE